jgi:hypothetical protein
VRCRDNSNVQQGSGHPERIEKLSLREHVGGLYVGAQIIGIIGLAVSVILGYLEKDEFRTFFNSYMIGYLFFLSISLGALFFVLLQHATRAGWSVNVRRVAEWYAATMPLMAALSVPILAAIVMGRGALYPWAKPGWGADMGFKGWWLGRGFFIGRAIFYLLVWSLMGVWFWKQSIKQDETGDINLTHKMQRWASPGLVLYGLTLTYMAWDWVMSLDPVWYSTIFGVYFFAGCALALFSTLVLSVQFLQEKGLLKSVTAEHYHDLGKFLFGFTFFWGYIAFSQFMLQWYGNIPDETEWFRRHGASTTQPNDFSMVLIALLFGQFVIPFAGLLSRHVKRNYTAIGFWALWVLVFCWVSEFWMVAPQLHNGTLVIGPMEVGEHVSVFLGIGGIFVAYVVRCASHHSIRPTHDPRLADSLAFENF